MCGIKWNNQAKKKKKINLLLDSLSFLKCASKINGKHPTDKKPHVSKLQTETLKGDVTILVRGGKKDF